MRVISIVRVLATDPISTSRREDLGTSYLKIGDEFSEDIGISGTREERIDFFERLAEAAAAASVELSADDAEATA